MHIGWRPLRKGFRSCIFTSEVTFRKAFLLQPVFSLCTSASYPLPALDPVRVQGWQASVNPALT